MHGNGTLSAAYRAVVGSFELRGNATVTLTGPPIVSNLRKVYLVE